MVQELGYRFCLIMIMLLTLAVMAPASEVSPAHDAPDAHGTAALVSHGEPTAVPHDSPPAFVDHATSPTSIASDTDRPTSATPATRHLTGVRVRPSADSLRVIFLFDQMPPHNLRLDLPNKRAYLELINARPGELPLDLARMNDSRLSGIWLTRAGAGMVTLEFRLRSSSTKIDQFTLKDPAALVLDISRADQPWLEVAADRAFAEEKAAPAANTHVAADHPATEAVINDSGSALPLDWQDSPAPGASGDSQTTITAHADTTTSGAMAEELHALGQSMELGPRSIEYEDFPIQAIDVRTPLAQEILDDFIARRWGLVIEKSLKYMELNRVNRETAYLLYLLAEARWQKGNQLRHPPTADMMNFYQQALRSFDGGELGAFGHWRLAQLYGRMQDEGNALPHLERALASVKDPLLRRKMLLAKARMLAETNKPAAAMAQLEQVAKENPPADMMVQILLEQASLQMKQNKPEDAWNLFQQANQIDPKWTNLYINSCEEMARAALATNRLQEADALLKFINANFPFRKDEEKVKLGLLYAEVRARLGDIATAEETFAELLNIDSKFNKTAIGQRVSKLMPRNHANELVEGYTRYALLLADQGKIHEAMKELHLSYQQCLREGIDVEPLSPVIETVVPAFMDYALAHDKSYDAAQAWWTYGNKIRNPELIQKGQERLVEALVNMGLYREALNLINQLKTEKKKTNQELPLRLRFEEAVLRKKMGESNVAIPQLEALTAETNESWLLQQGYEHLAEAYQEQGRPLEAAQAWQSLTEAPGVDAPAIGHGLLEAGRLYLEQAEKTQTPELALKATDLGLRGLILEKQIQNQKSMGSWSPSTGDEMRLMLGRSYYIRADYSRVIIILEDYLERPNIPADDRALALLMLGESRRRLHQKEDARAIYEQAAGKDTPELWRKAAAQSQKSLDWDLKHPQWSIADKEQTR